KVKVNVRRVGAEELEEDNASLDEIFQGVHGILVPGGFGNRGIEGKIQAIQYARENEIPFFGICLGMQVATIEFARNVVGLEGANSGEFDKTTAHPVIDLMDDQKEVKDKGGTMRLGAYPCDLLPGSKARDAYESDRVSERHRHRYEFNNKYRDQFEEKGLVFSGLSPDRSLVEIVELEDHPWFMACQFHPEFQSKPTEPHSLFTGFVGAVIHCKNQKTSCSL
ncbi:MAG: CTP synthase, partial [Planctomycetota bacterium]|nr:CTP synthase [Planctomycetota bacterium]